MSKFDRLAVTGAVEGILRREFGRLYEWVKPDILKTVGPFEPAVFEEYDVNIQSLLSECFGFLKNSTDVELEAISSTYRVEETGARDAWRAMFANKFKELKKDEPFWAAGGFGHPDYVADFEYWGRMPSLTVSEAVSFSLGVEPKHLDYLISAEESLVHDIANPLIFAQRRAEQFKRQFHIISSTHKIKTPQLLEWVTAVDLDVHTQALEVLERFHGSCPKVVPPSKSPDKRELESVAMLFTVMAIDHLGYDPKAKRSPVPKEIADLAADIGLSVTDDTVRKYLKLGARFIPDDWEPS